MKAENRFYESSRTVLFENIPTSTGRPYLDNLPSSMKVTINYTDENIPVIEKAVSLDNIIIPEIINAINLYHEIRNMFVGVDYDELTESEKRIVNFLIDNKVNYVNFYNDIQSVDYDNPKHLAQDAAKFDNKNVNEFENDKRRKTIQLFQELKLIEINETNTIKFLHVVLND